MLVATVPAVADSFEGECEADDGGACKDVAISSYEYDENNLTEEDSVEDPLFRRQLGSAASSPLMWSEWVALVAF